MGFNLGDILALAVEEQAIEKAVQDAKVGDEVTVNVPAGVRIHPRGRTVDIVEVKLKVIK